MSSEKERLKLKISLQLLGLIIPKKNIKRRKLNYHSRCYCIVIGFIYQYNTSRKTVITITVKH